MLKADKYYIECEVAVLAKATGGLLSPDGDIVDLHYKIMLKMKDYGRYEPEGWEYEIDESPFYDLDEINRYKPYRIYLINPYHDEFKIKIPKDLRVIEVYKTKVFKINTDVEENYRKE